MFMLPKPDLHFKCTANKVKLESNSVQFVFHSAQLSRMKNESNNYNKDIKVVQKWLHQYDTIHFPFSWKTKSPKGPKVPKHPKGPRGPKGPKDPKGHQRHQDH